MIQVNSIRIYVPVETFPRYPEEGKIDVRECLECVGINLEGATIEIDQKLLCESNEEREFEVNSDNTIITHRIVGDLERLPKHVTVDAYLHYCG